MNYIKRGEITEREEGSDREREQGMDTRCLRG